VRRGDSRGGGTSYFVQQEQLKGIISGVFHGNVGIRKALRCCQQSKMLAARVGGHRRGSPRYSYNAGSAGLVDGAGYPAHIWVVGCCYWRNLVRDLEGAAQRFIKNMEKVWECLEDSV
jgi:hypothetical protein